MISTYGETGQNVYWADITRNPTAVGPLETSDPLPKDAESVGRLSVPY
jgi:hypothetical protein